LPVVNFTTAPAILTGLILYSGILFFFRKDKKTGVLLFLKTLTIAAFLITFYWVLPTSQEALSPFLNISAFRDSFNWSLYFELVFRALGYLFTLYGLLFIVFLVSYNRIG